MTKAELIAFSKKSPVVVICGVLGVALLGAWFYFKDDIDEQTELLAQRTELADRYALNVKNSAQLKQQYDALVAANKAIDARIIRASQLGANAQYFYTLETQTGVKLVSDPRQTTPATVGKPAKGSFVPVGFSISVQGTLSQLLDFLRALESGEHYCRVLTASFGVNASKRSGPLTLSLTVELLGTP
jgi:type II secretory pathway pseudopilin PulG